MRIYLCGINSDSGKTIVSSVLCRRYGADYFKPLQTGQDKDSDTIRKLVIETRIHDELYCFSQPISIHTAAEIDGVKIKKENLVLPSHRQNLVVESAGGILSPVTNDLFMIDLAVLWNLPVILVVNFYLGSINHTLLSIEFLKKKKVKVLGLVFNGKVNESSKNAIMHNTEFPELFTLPHIQNLNASTIAEAASTIEFSDFQI